MAVCMSRRICVDLYADLPNDTLIDGEIVAFGGLRMGEILGLRWRDIDLEQGRMAVSQALQRQKGRGLVLTETKTDRSRRTIALPVKLVAALKAHRVRQLEERLAAGSRWQDSGFVFASGVGTGLEPRNLHRTFKAILERARIPDIRFHDLRHSAASLMLAQSVPARGHGSPRTLLHKSDSQYVQPCDALVSRGRHYESCQRSIRLLE
jgi:integrase